MAGPLAVAMAALLVAGTAAVMVVEKAEPMEEARVALKAGLMVGAGVAAWAARWAELPRSQTERCLILDH